MKWSFFPFSVFFHRHARTIETNKGKETHPFIGSATSSGEIVTIDNSMRLSAVWACVNLRSRIIGSMPLHIKDANRKTDIKNPLYNLLHTAPNADMTASEFWTTVALQLDLHGNSYAKISRNKDKQVSSLWLLNPQKVVPVRLKNGSVSYSVYSDKAHSQLKTEYKEDDIVHFRGMSFDGLIGLSPIEYASEYIGSQKAANKAADNSFETSLKAGGFIESGEQILNENQRENLRNRLSEFSKKENAGKFVVLEAGQKVSTYKPFVTAVDADLLESRKFGIEEICRIFGVPPVLIGHTSKSSSWASSLEQTNLQFLTHSIDPTLVRMEQTILRKLVPQSDWNKTVIKFNRGALLRADLAARTAFYTAATLHGWIDRNELREKEDMEVRDEKNANTLTVQSQMIPIDAMGNGIGQKNAHL